MNEMLCEVLNLCYKISTESEADVFFEYIPHCNAYRVYVYPHGWKPNTDKLSLTGIVEALTEESLENTIIQLKAIAMFLEVAL